MVKDPAHAGPGELHYHDIGDYLTQQEKLDIIEGFGSIDAMPWVKLAPNAEGDWANQRDPAFERFIPMGEKGESDKQLFAAFSLGVSTNRDAWVYNMSHSALQENMEGMIDCYNRAVGQYARACDGKPGSAHETEKIVR